MGKRVKGDKLRSLMKRYSLEGDAGADVVAELLHTTRSTVMGWYSKGIPINEYELLERKLAER